MATRTHHAPLNIVALGWGFSAALAVLFVICLMAALLLPLRPAHGWVGLWSAAPLTSAQFWAEGIAYSIAAGWIGAGVFGAVYNYFVSR